MEGDTQTLHSQTLLNGLTIRCVGVTKGTEPMQRLGLRLNNAHNAN